MISVVHLVPRISRGGGTASPLNIARQLQLRGSSSHLFVSLAKAEPETAQSFEKEAFPIINAPNPEQLDELMAQADIVQVDWWNTPETANLLSRALPPSRLVLWSVVTGDAPPHVISEDLLAKVDHFVACSPYSMELPSVKNLSNPSKKEFIHIPANFGRLRNLRKKEHEGFNIGYIGTIDYAKMHRDYLAMCKSLDIPEVRFLVCGQGRSLGELKDQSIKQGMGDRFRFFGYVEDIAEVISEMDVYGYPLNENTFAAAELNLQEVMWAGLPIVSSPHGGVPFLIQHEETGLLVDNEKDYRLAMEHLYHHPAERERLGKNAAAYARKHFDPEISADRFEKLYAKILSRPKEAKPPTRVEVSSSQGSTSQSGARLLIESIGDFAKPLRTSMESMQNADALAADKEIAGSDDLFHQGCIIQFLHAYPTDPWLHLWNGLMKWTGKSFSGAHDSWSMAVRYGIERQRVFNYLAHVSEMEPHPEAREKLARIRALIDESLPTEEKEVSPPWERLLLAQNLTIQERLLVEVERIIKSKPRIIHPELKLSRQIGKALEKSNSRPIFLWGAGVAGQKVKAAMDLLKEFPQGFIDRSEKIDDQVLGLPVFSPEILEGGESAFVLICTMHYRQVSESLEKLGLKPTKDFLALHVP
ncbi:glycosyltransferase family 4 protein [Verrucomicrobia bacterium]|nr:glycosyltransferase family 4 protein [Verrucomicrobiota bacterium]